MTDTHRATVITEDEVFAADQATIDALIDWCRAHNVTPEAVVAAAGFWLGLNSEDVQADLKLAHQILDEFVQAGSAMTPVQS
jgi:hypothetical protein